MYEGTYRKIAENASYLRRIHTKGNIENLELFNKPFKLALNELDCHSMLNLRKNVRIRKQEK